MSNRIAPPEIRVWRFVDAYGCCWEWTGSKKENGYGTFYAGKDRPCVIAHRYVYELMIGPIPPGLEIDHLCRNKGCVNPEHLEAVTREENMRRQIMARGRYLRCGHGHLLTDGNLRIDAHGWRHCRTCETALTRNRPFVVCLGCGQEKRHQGRGLCRACLQRARHLDVAQDYPVCGMRLLPPPQFQSNTVRELDPERINARRQEAALLRKQGKTYAEIGVIFGISAPSARHDVMAADKDTPLRAPRPRLAAKEAS